MQNINTGDGAIVSIRRFSKFSNQVVVIIFTKNHQSH